MRTTTGNKRLDEAIRKELKVNRGGQIWLDCFMGRTSHTEIAPTITTRTSSDNNNFIMERNVDEDILGISEAFNHALEWRSRGADGMIRRDVSPALRATDYKCPKYVWYKSSERNMNEDKNQEQKIVEPINAMPDETATTLTTAHHYAGNIVNPKRGQKEMGVRENFRIRKLTPRECFRLMDVDDKDIDKIQAYPFENLIEHPAYSKQERANGMTEKEKRRLMRKSISETQQYKLAGNSIVVNVLTEIFRKLFVDTQPDDGQMKMF